MTRVMFLVACASLVACEAPTPEPTARPAQVAPTERPAPPGEPAPEPEPEPEPAPPPPEVAPELERTVARSINELTFDLQRALGKRPGNVFGSGMSVAVGLAMLHAGSGGATEKELAKLLSLEGPVTGLHAGFAGLAARWTHPDEKVTLRLATRLFGEEKFAFKPAYLDLTRDVFGAQLETLDFMNDPNGARERINGWVRTETRDKIPELLAPEAVTALTRLVLADAVYFKADWEEPFDAKDTAPEPFYGENGKREVQMMRTHQRLRFTYGKAGKLRVLELPYRGGDYSMVILLPGTRAGLPALERTFDADDLQSWLDAAHPTQIELRLPRFSLDYRAELAPVLQKLGAATAFNPKRADFGPIAVEKVALAAVHHRARIEVEERGTEAAAATAIEVSVGGLPGNAAPFIVDRPFLFYIRDVRSGVLLFFGRLSDPV